jgi:hypothetical protein
MTPGAVGILKKRTKSVLKRSPKSKGCFSHQIPGKSKMIFNEKWGKGIYPLPRPWHFNQNQ